ncbi:FAD-binding oxidoreductase [Ilyomonas limi]|uniref:FAD-binding oxidoreductase n=1 Tax=Ilyomonas limi TaxID=2575867 RepID=A0A4U3L1I2_9BACT|nr:FAD-dependent oxidoreductase [Ilyomonas limi]TKK68642.1 FAD-binding oxidoreductase [Ilyomonas limi]
MQVDYIILGQGISGTFLSYYLQQQGKTVLVIDTPQSYTASKIASGVINPVTGRRIVKTWLIDELLPFCWSAYTEIGNLLAVSLIRQCNVLDFHATPQMQEAFASRIAEDASLLCVRGDKAYWQQYFRFNYGIGEVNPCWLVDLQTLLPHWRQYLMAHNALLEDYFDWKQCEIAEEKVQYKNITASKILCCEGVGGARNPYFQLLPFALNKGDAIIAHIPNLPATNIYKQGISIVPWNEKDVFWIGSTYDWNYADVQPTAAFKSKVEAQLDYWLKLPYTLTDHFAAERPANVERRPFVGLHPVHSAVGILNGMGTKGCSLAPYFAHQLTAYLVDGLPIEPLANVQRFTQVLSR